MRRLYFVFILLSSGCHHDHAEVPPTGPLGGSGEPLGCASSPIYMLVGDESGSTELRSFDPTTATYASLGPITCPGDFAIGPPNSVLAVDHAGQIFIAYGACGDEWLYRLDPKSLDCEPTPFKRSVDGNYNDCLTALAFDADSSSATGETLYFLGSGLEVAPVLGPMATPYYLGAVDPTTSMSRVIGPLAAPAQAARSRRIPLAGSADGTLYIDYNAYANTDLGSDIGVVDTANAEAMFEWQITTAPTASEAGSYRLFSAWQGDFYLFNYAAQTQTGEVVRFRPSDGSAASVAANPHALATAAPACVAI